MPRRRGRGSRNAKSLYVLPAREAIVKAAGRIIIKLGHARLSTRAVAAEADVNQSLIHYYFGTREKLMLAVLEQMNEALFTRQTSMYDAPLGFPEKWAQACLFYEQDLASGYTRLLMELSGMGVSNPTIGREVRKIRVQWRALIERVAREALEHFGITSVTPGEIAAYVTCFWEGMDLELMLGVPEEEGHHWDGLKTFERFLRYLEAEKAAGRRPAIV